MSRLLCWLFLGACFALSIDAGQIEDAVRELESGRLLFRFAARDGVCSDDFNGTVRSGRWRCDGELVSVLLTVQDGELVRLKSQVSSKRRLSDAARDLGEVATEEAAAFLLPLAREANERVADEALNAVVLARDVVIWPDLLEFARDRERPKELRETAIFWLGQSAGEKCVEGLEQLVGADAEDIELREHAIFALSQRKTSESLPALMRIARTHEIGQLRQTALFWLAQVDDPAVVDLFAEILGAD